MTAALPLIQNLRRVTLPMLPHRIADVDDLKQILLQMDAAIDAASGGGVAGSAAIGLDITKPPYSAPNDGTGNCSPILEQALADGHRVIWFPKGIYRFETTVIIPVDTFLIGENPHTVLIRAHGERWLDCQCRQGGDGKPNAARVHVANFWVHMIGGGGIRFSGHENRCWNMKFSGGVPGHWAIEFYASNECAVWNISGGYGTTQLEEMVANGIRWYATDNEATINYGDSLIEEVAFKGSVAGWIGLCFEHLGNNSSRGLINNITVVRCQFQAPGTSSDPLCNPYDPSSVRVRDQSIGVKLDSVARCTFIGIDCEATFYGFYARGRSPGLGPRATKRNTFITCQGFNTRHGFYAENPNDGSVGQNHFIGCQEMQPLLPVAFANGDPNGTYLGRASPHDWFLPNALWFARPGNGVPKVALRATDGEQLYIVHDYQEPERASGVKYPYDGAPKYKTPRKALAIDVATALNAARIYRPQGFVAENSLSGTTNDGTAPGAPRKDSRIVIGNGPNLVIDGQPINPLHRVEIADPLYIAEWHNPLVTIYGGDAPSIIANARYENVLGTTPRWRGPGLYASMRVPGTTSFEWVPLASIDGWMTAHLGRAGSSYTVDRSWFGRFIEHTAATTITIPADIISADEQTAAAGLSASRFFVIKCGVFQVTLQAGSGVSMYVAGSASAVSSWTMPTPASCAIVHYTRTGNGTARVDITPLGGAGSGGAISVDHVATQLGDGAQLNANNAWVRASGATLIFDMPVVRHATTPSSPVSLTINAADSTVGRVWSLRVADDQTGAVTIAAPSGGSINGRTSIGVRPRGGRIEIECIDATSGAQKYRAWGDIELPPITSSQTWLLDDVDVERVITANNVIVTVPQTFNGQAAIFCAANTATLRINNSTDIALTQGDIVTFRGNGSITYAYRADPTVS